MPSFFGWLARFFEAIFSSFVAGVAAGAGLVLVVVPPFYFGDIESQKWFMCAVIPIIAIASGVAHFVTVVSPLILLSRRLRHCSVVVREHIAEVDKAVKLGALPPLLEVPIPVPSQQVPIAPAARSFALSRSLFNSPHHAPSTRGGGGGAGTLTSAFRAYQPARTNPLALSVPDSRANTPTPQSDGSSFAGTPTRVTSFLDSPGDRQTSVALSGDAGIASTPALKPVGGFDGVAVSMDMVTTTPISTVNEDCIRERLHALQRCPRLMRQDDNTRADASHRDVRQTQHAALELLKNLDAQNIAMVEQWSALVSWLSEQLSRLQQQNQVLNHQLQSLCAATRHNSMFTIPEEDASSAPRGSSRNDPGVSSQHSDPNRRVAPLSGISQESVPLSLHERTPTCPPSAFDRQSPSQTVGESPLSKGSPDGDGGGPTTYDECAANEEKQRASETGVTSFNDDSGVMRPPSTRNTKRPPKQAGSGTQMLPQPVYSSTKRHMSLSTEGDVPSAAAISPTQKGEAAGQPTISLATPRPVTPLHSGWEPLGLDLQNTNLTVRLILNRGHRFPSDSHDVFFYVYRKYGSHSGPGLPQSKSKGSLQSTSVPAKKNTAASERKHGPETLMEWLVAFRCTKPLHEVQHPSASAFDSMTPLNLSTSGGNKDDVNGFPTSEAERPFELFEWTPTMRMRHGSKKNEIASAKDDSPAPEPSVPEAIQRKFGIDQCAHEEVPSQGAPKLTTPTTQTGQTATGGAGATPTSPGSPASFICTWAPLPKRPMRLCSLPVFLNGKERKYVPVLETLINKVFCVVECAEIVTMAGFDDQLSPQTSVVGDTPLARTPLSSKTPASPTSTEALLLKGVCIEDDTGGGIRFGESVVELVPMPHLT